LIIFISLAFWRPLEHIVPMRICISSLAAEVELEMYNIGNT
jgi:hypothetical protein